MGLETATAPTDISGLDTDLTTVITLLLAIQAETNKIDLVAVSGLLGASNSSSYKVHEIEKHFHSRGRYWGAVAVPSETNAIEANVNRPFQATSGANAWGAAIPILGTADMPVPTGLVKFDAHRLLITDLDDDTTPWRVRIIWGTGTSVAAIAAEQWSEEMIISNSVPGNRAGGVPLDFQMPRNDVGIKNWAQAWNDTDGEVLSFFWGCHGYVG